MIKLAKHPNLKKNRPTPLNIYKKVMATHYMDKSTLDEITAVIDDIEDMVNNGASEDELRAKGNVVRELVNRIQ